MMRKLIYVVFLLLYFLSSLNAFAAGPATVYKVTLTKFEMYNGTSWVTIFEGSSTTIDIASASSGAAAGNFLSGLIVPDGTYTMSRATPSATFVVRGNDGTRYTLATNGSNGGCTYTTTASLAADCTVNVPGGVTADTTTFSSPITVTNNVPSHKVRVSFDVSTAISYNSLANEIFPAAPTVTVTTIAY